MTRAFLLSVVLLIAASAGLHSEEPGTPDEELGLAKGSVFAVLVPEPVAPETSDPGDKPLLARDFDGSPPRVPHSVADFVPIQRGENLCVDCHAIQEAEPGEPTPMPASHYTDYRNAPDRLSDSLIGARYVCVTCHVAPTAAGPLVGSRFGVEPQEQPPSGR